MGRGHSTEMRTAIIAYVEAGRTMRDAARHFGVSPSSVVKLIKKKAETPEAYEPRKAKDDAGAKGIGDIVVGAQDLADCLGVDKRSVTEFATRGLIVRKGRNQYALLESLRTYCEHLRGIAAGRGGDANQALASERARLAKEQADNTAMKNSELRRELLSTQLVEREWSDILRTVRSRVLACPSRIRGRLPHLTPHDGQIIDRELRDALSELANDTGDTSQGHAGADAAGQAEPVGLDGA